MAKNKATDERRSIYYIKKEFQRRFILKFLALIALGSILANWVLYTFLQAGIENALYRAHIVIKTTGEVVMSPLIMTGAIIIVAAVVAVAATMLLSSYSVSNRLRYLAKGVEALKRGDLTIKVETPKGCKFPELYDIFNDTVDSLDDKIIRIKSSLGDLERVASDYERNKKKDTQELLLKKVDEVEKDISAFKLRQG